MEVILNAGEIAVLMAQHPSREEDGGWQALIGRLQKDVNLSSGNVTIITKDLERIPHYAFDYGNDGWEHALMDIFGRTLGARLGR